MQNKLFYLFILLTTTIISQNIVVNDQLNADDLINILFDTAPICANVENITVTGGDFGTGENSYGFFDATGTSFQFTQGIVLSTGKAINAEGPNNFISNDGDLSWGPDINSNGTSDLEDITGVSGTLNATVLEFDYTPATNFISFEYIFASDAYRDNSSTCLLSDEFAFLIKPVGFGSYTNIAITPDTNSRISILTVHPTILFDNGNIACVGENEDYFESFNPINSPTNYNGQTKILTAFADVIIGQKYHLKIIIADDENPLIDSAVFFNIGSASFSNLFIGPDLLIANGTALCPNETTTLDAGIALNYQWSKDGLPISQNQTILVTEPGIYEIVTGDPVCGTNTDSIIIEYDILPIVFDTTLLECTFNNGTTAIFDLNNAISVITDNDSNLVIEGFYLTFDNAENSPNTAIDNPENFANITLNQEIFVRVSNSSGCVAIAKIILEIGSFPNIEDDETVIYCLNEFPDTITLQSGLLEINPNEFLFNWSTNETTQDIEINQPGDYIITITRVIDGCFVSRIITVQPSNPAIFQKVLVTDMDNRERNSIVVINSGIGDYEYSLDNDAIFQDSNAFAFLTYGEHKVFIRDKNGCVPITEGTFVLLDNPRFFTPNGDGVNDLWNINNINRLNSQFNTISNITIFDRFGKIMTVVDPLGLGWNGNFKGELAPPDDYWYSLILTNFNGEVILKQGHFSLSR